MGGIDPSVTRATTIVEVCAVGRVRSENGQSLCSAQSSKGPLEIGDQRGH
jgi:hypothetical protein